MSVFQVLERLGDFIQREENLVIDSKTQLEEFHSKLMTNQEVLQDAEIRGIMDPNVKSWLQRVRDLAYDMTDVLDEWAYTNLELQIQESEDVTDLMQKVLLLFQSICPCFKHVDRRNIILKVKELNMRLDSIVMEKDMLGLFPSGSSHLQELRINVRDSEKETLLNKMFSVEGLEGTSIVAVVGSAGMGKTTLVRQAYNDSKVSRNFDARIWIHVSDAFDQLRIAKQILEAVGKSFYHEFDLDALLQHVRTLIAGKKFLLVLDDVWIEDYRMWEPFKNSLQGAPGSIVLVTTRSESTAKMMGATNLQHLRTLSDDDSWSLFRNKSVSSVDFSRTDVGDSEMQSLLNNLFSAEGRKGIGIVAVVGIGGIGKTTLVRQAYNDPKVSRNFDLRIWIDVSDTFDQLGIAKQILEAVGKSFYHGFVLDVLLRHVRTSIAGKKFLLVLDDVWIEDYRMWEPFKNSLQGAPGSIVLVTTRSESTAKTMGATNLQHLGIPSEDDCWLLLSEMAFMGRSEEEREKLEHIGRKIANKCHGLPLAARTLGGLLCSKTTVQEWQSVLDSPFWQIKEISEELFPPLYLSYNQLSPQLKACFSSCAIFPKDYRMQLDELIRLWMAHGYLSSSASSYEVQLKGLEYFWNLGMRSFFQELKHDEYNESYISCKMNDKMHDFAIFLLKSEHCFIMDGRVEMGENNNERAYDLNSLFNSDMGKIRTFCARNVSQLEKLIGHLTGAWVLIAADCDFQEVPPEIGKSIHLRYLDLSGNPIRELPVSLCNLYNLQTLDLRKCVRLIALPEDIYKLVKLRHLLVGSSMKLFPQGLERLNGLWTLNRFVAGRGSGKLGYLKNLNQLRGYLVLLVQDMNEEEDLVDAVNSELKNKTSIQELELKFTGFVRRDVMNALEPPPNVKRLQINGYLGTELPDWITTSLNYLTVLHILLCYNFSTLPSLGKLPMLEELDIDSLESMKHLGKPFLGTNSIETAFPKLKRLCFYNCQNWTKWEDVTEKDKFLIMPCLSYLEIVHCRNLKTLPCRLLGMQSSPEFLAGDIKLWRDINGKDGQWVELNKISNTFLRRHVEIQLLEG